MSKAPVQEADGERDVSLGAKWDMEACACSKKKLQNIVQNQGKKHFTNTQLCYQRKKMLSDSIGITKVLQNTNYF